METEGVIKFNLAFELAKLPDIDISGLNAWRSVLKQLQLIGQDPDRYEGYGFGNLSMRYSGSLGSGFLITGTQTGDTEMLSADQYALCTSWNLAGNEVAALGRTRPSSESLSHAAVYDSNAATVCAFHVHCPEIWQSAADLGIVVTNPQVAYGTPEMANEVINCLKGQTLPAIFSMGGHEDGVFTLGETLDAAGTLLVETLVRARRLNPSLDRRGDY